MVTFVRNEIGQNVPHVERKVAPRIGGGDGDYTASVKTERKQIEDAAATAAQSWKQRLGSNLVSIDGSRHNDAVLVADRLYPHVPGIVNVPRDHPTGASR